MYDTLSETVYCS
jgi:hypothetical protein